MWFLVSIFSSVFIKTKQRKRSFTESAKETGSDPDGESTCQLRQAHESQIIGSLLLHIYRLSTSVQEQRNIEKTD